MSKLSWRLAGLTSTAGGTLIALTLWGCGSAGEGPELQIATSQGRLQWNYLATSETDTRYGVNLLTASSNTTRKGRSTGALRHTTPSGATKGDDGNCGVTFISPHYAVTASHCVAAADGYTINGGGFTVEQFDTTALDLNALGRSTTVTDLYNNNYVGDWYRASPMSAANGYRFTSYKCTLIQRCKSGYGPVSCPNTNNIDQALIRCGTSAEGGPQRPSSTTNWVPVRSSDSANLNVEIWWFHEVLDLSTNGVDTPYMPANNSAHYRLLNTSAPLNNYHYFQTQTLPGNVPQMLPLRSKTAIGGAAYHTLSASASPGYTDTNVPGCHGTSGSGVFAANEDNFLGNVVNGGTWATSYECDPAFSSGPQSNKHLDYVKPTETANLQNQTFVKNDRP